MATPHLLVTPCYASKEAETPSSWTISEKASGAILATARTSTGIEKAFAGVVADYGTREVHFTAFKADGKTVDQSGKYKGGILQGGTITPATSKDIPAAVKGVVSLAVRGGEDHLREDRGGYFSRGQRGRERGC